ncbi:hypothetical protein D3C79_900460 [compost metagenome]
MDIKHDLIEKIGNDRSESTGANHQAFVGKDAELVVKGAQKVTVGQGMEQHTTIYQVRASERIEFMTAGGSIVLDGQGITINGLKLDLLGQTSAAASGAGGSQPLELAPDASNKCEAKV